MVESRDDFYRLLKIFIVQGCFLFVFFFNLVIRDTRDDIRYQATGNVLSAMAQENNRTLPVRIKIPKIGVDANIQSVGVAASGDMDVPSNADDVGWFEMGARPGELGSAVMAGHFDDKDGRAGVFYGISNLEIGDELFIEDDKGIFLTFVVRGIRIFDPGYVDEVFNQVNGKYLNIITCDGAWDNKTKSFSKRLVVFTELR
jgi:LPXTG-site transpeptidase (sortase) family protein